MGKVLVSNYTSEYVGSIRVVDGATHANWQKRRFDCNYSRTLTGTEVVNKYGECLTEKSESQGRTRGDRMEKWQENGDARVCAASACP